MDRSLSPKGGVMLVDRGHRSRGTSLIEVLVALAILALLMVGILQMFSFSLLVNQGSGARTQVTYKAQQVVEQIRFIQYLRRSNLTAAATSMSASSGIPVTLSATTFNLPYVASDPNWAFWGPAQNNVIEEANGPYKISYSVSDGGTVWIVTVTAQAQSVGTAAAGSRVFFGTGMGNKRIDYVAEIPKV
jgi:prepilin-type N-terminal cleavage/methylation domain-containing protein